MTKTTHVRAAEVEDRWYLYDASEHVLGHLAARIAVQLMGKDRPEYTPSELGGAHVVVINAAQAQVTGAGSESKEYPHYTGYPGGLRVTTLAQMRKSRPRDIVKLAVRRMLPKTRLGKRMLSRLKVYAGPEHRHAAQKPVQVDTLQELSP